MENVPPDIIADFRIILNRFSRMVSGIPEQDPGENRRRLDALCVEIARCTACPLPADGIRLTASGDISASILIVDKNGSLLTSSDARELLYRMFDAINIDKESLYLTTVYKCRPNSPAGPLQPPSCTQFLDRELRLIEPLAICALGEDTAAALSGSFRDMSLIHGQKMSYRGIPLFAIRHPLFLLDNPEYKKETWSDLQIFRNYYRKAACRVLS